MKYSKAQLAHDTLLIEILASNGLTKQAQSGIISSIIDRVKSYVSDHINPEDKVGSVINILIPGALAMLGFPIVGFIVEIATSWFGLNLGKMLEDVASSIKSLIVGGAKTTSSAVEGVVHNVFAQHAGSDPTQEEFQTAQAKPLKALSMREVQMYKATLYHIKDQKIHKEAIPFVSTFSRFIGLKSTTVRALMAIVGWVVKVILASAGFMVADDAIHSLVGSHSHTDFSSPKPTSNTAPAEAGNFKGVQTVTSTQTTFKVNPSYEEERLNLADRWIEPVAPSQIGNELVAWTHDIYPATKSLTDDQIRNTAGFKKVIDAIDQYNATNKLNVTFIPKVFTSHKKVVDMFIDELAHEAPIANPTTQAPTVPAPTMPSSPIKSPHNFYDITYK